MLKKIVIKGAKEHNLKNISLEIPKDKTGIPIIAQTTNNGFAWLLNRGINIPIAVKTKPTNNEIPPVFAE